MSGGRILANIAEATARWDWQTLDQHLDLARRVLHADQIDDALLVAAGFNGITRVADAIGIPLEDHTENSTRELRADAGIDAFARSEKWAREG